MDSITLDLEKAVKAALDEVERTAHGACLETLDAISKEALKIAKENAPERTGEYKKSLKRKTIKKSGEISGYQIHSTTSISHLLENGHLTRDGTSTVPGKPHFAPAQKYADEQIETEFQKHFQKGEG